MVQNSMWSYFSPKSDLERKGNTAVATDLEQQLDDVVIALIRCSSRRCDSDLEHLCGGSA